MAWAGGVFSRVRNWAQDKLNAINPQAALFDSEDDNFAAGLNNCVTKDGLNRPTATMDFNAQRLSNLAAPTTVGDAVRVEAATTFTGTLTGYAANPTGTVSYFKANNIVTLSIAANISGTSNSSNLTMSGLPAAVTPTNARTGICAFGIDNGVSCMVSFQVTAVNTIIFSPFLAGTFSTWTTSGTKGLAANWFIVYPL